MSKIASIDTFPASYAVRGPFFKFFAAPAGQAPSRETVFVRITDEDGNVGWGQCVPSPTWSYETPHTVLTTIRHYLAPALLGLDTHDVAEIQSRMNRTIAPSFSIGQPICKAGIDLALVDLNGRKSRTSFAQQLGRATSTRITLSWTLNPRHLDELGEQIEAGHSHGFRHFNLKVGGDLKFDLDVCREARRLAGDAFLWADANGGYDLASALEAARAMADLGMEAFEQPVAANRLGWCARLKQLGALPIVLDEPIVSRVDIEEFHRLGLLDGVAIKVARCGGLHEAASILDYIESEGLLLLASGLTDPDLSFAASLVLLGAYQFERPAALNAPQYLEGSYLRQPLTVVGDRAHVPTGPGLGVEVDDSQLAPAT